jgi:nitroreductase
MNETLLTISSLRTVHGQFSERKITEDDLNTIIDASLKAANASARQSYAIIVSDDRKKMRDLFAYEGSHALVYCVDFTRLDQLAAHTGHKFNSTDIIGFTTGTMDAMLAAQTAVIAAKSLGIDSLITNALHRKNLDAVYELLGLPKTSCFPLIAIIFGYSAKEKDQKKGRLSRQYLVHRERYQPLTNTQLDQIVKEYDDSRLNIGLMANWEKLGFQHYLDWFFTKWCEKPPKRDVAEGRVLEFQKRLRDSGFWFPMKE